MRHYTDSDFYKSVNAGNSFQNKLAQTLRSISPRIILNDKIDSDLDQLKKVYKESIIIKVINAIKKNELIIICPTPENRFQSFCPFVKAKVKGKECVIIDVSAYTSVKLGEDNEIEGYSVDIDKLYALTVPAYISLKLYGPGVVLPSEATKYLSYIFARMFCNTLQTNALGVLQNHAERYEAFMYFAMRFFMIYYLECPMGIVDSISNGFLSAGKSEYINFIESRVADMGINLYENFGCFCRNLFNNEITNIKGMAQKVNDVNQSTFLTIFKNQYSINAIMSLCSVDYFTYAIFAAYSKVNIMNDRGFDVVLVGRRNEYKRDVPRLFDALYKEV